MADMLPELLTTAEVAAALRVDRQTVLRWAKDGSLPSVANLPGRLRRFRRDDVERLLSTPKAS